MSRITDEWGLRYPGVKHVEHVYFYEAAIADPPKLEEYLRRAYRRGKDSPFQARRHRPRDDGHRRSRTPARCRSLVVAGAEARAAVVARRAALFRQLRRLAAG